MRNSCNQISTLSNTAEIVENERPVHLTPLLSSSFEQRIRKGQNNLPYPIPKNS